LTSVILNNKHVEQLALLMFPYISQILLMMEIK